MDYTNLTPPTYDGDINEHLPKPEGFSNRDISSEPLDVIVEDHGTKTLVIAFGGCGMNPDTGESQYGYAGFLQQYDVSRILVRDHFLVWYLIGVRGLSTDVESTVISLQKLITEIQPQETLAVGTSGGGFAAILFGVLVGLDRVVAINPQTLLQRGVECYAHGNLYQIKWTNPSEEQYRDLTNLPETDTMVDIVYGKDSPVDYFHSNRMRVLSNIRVTEVEGDHGTAALAMRDDGRLEKILSINETQNGKQYNP